MLVRSEIAGQKQILWIFGYKKGKNSLILSLGLRRIISLWNLSVWPTSSQISTVWLFRRLVAHCSLVSTLTAAAKPLFALLAGGINWPWIYHRVPVLQWRWQIPRRPGRALARRALARTFLPGYRGFLRAVALMRLWVAAPPIGGRRINRPAAAPGATANGPR